MFVIFFEDDSKIIKNEEKIILVGNVLFHDLKCSLCLFLCMLIYFIFLETFSSLLGSFSAKTEKERRNFFKFLSLCGRNKNQYMETKIFSKKKKDIFVHVWPIKIRNMKTIFKKCVFHLFIHTLLVAVCL